MFFEESGSCQRRRTHGGQIPAGPWPAKEKTGKEKFFRARKKIFVTGRRERRSGGASRAAPRGPCRRRWRRRTPGKKGKGPGTPSPSLFFMGIRQAQAAVVRWPPVRRDARAADVRTCAEGAVARHGPSAGGGRSSPPRGHGRGRGHRPGACLRGGGRRACGRSGGRRGDRRAGQSGRPHGVRDGGPDGVPGRSMSAWARAVRLAPGGRAAASGTTARPAAQQA